MSPTIAVAPAALLFDERPTVFRVEGLQPRQRCTVRYAMQDEKARFGSAADFVADERGTVDLVRRPPLPGGSYACVDAAGLFWSVEPSPGQRAGVRFIKRDVGEPVAGHVEVCVDGAVVARRDLPRKCFSDGVERVVLDYATHRLVGELFLPAAPGPAPAVIDMFGAGGGLFSLRAALLASKGFTVLSLAFMGKGPDLPIGLDGLRFPYFEHAVAFLADHPRTRRSSGIGILGVSKGAELALCLAERLPVVRAVVAISPPHCRTYPGFLIQDRAPGAEPDFVAKGEKRLPCAEWDVTAIEEVGDDKICMYESAMPFLKTDGEALVDFGRTDAAILFVSGDDDDDWPATQMADRAVARLRQARHHRAFKHLWYPGPVGHLIEPSFGPTCAASHHAVFGVQLMWGGRLPEHALAQEDAWGKTVGWLQRELRVGSRM